MGLVGSRRHEQGTNIGHMVGTFRLCTWGNLGIRYGYALRQGTQGMHSRLTLSWGA